MRISLTVEDVGRWGRQRRTHIRVPASYEVVSLSANSRLRFGVFDAGLRILRPGPVFIYQETLHALDEKTESIFLVVRIGAREIQKLFILERFAGFPVLSPVFLKLIQAYGL